MPPTFKIFVSMYVQSCCMCVDVWICSVWACGRERGHGRGHGRGRVNCLVVDEMHVPANDALPPPSPCPPAKLPTLPLYNPVPRLCILSHDRDTPLPPRPSARVHADLQAGSTL